MSEENAKGKRGWLLRSAPSRFSKQLEQLKPGKVLKINESDDEYKSFFFRIYESDDEETRDKRRSKNYQIVTDELEVRIIDKRLSLFSRIGELSLDYGGHILWQTPDGELESAEGKEGFILHSPWSKGFFFRIYDENKNFKDYRLDAYDIQIEIIGDFTALYEDKIDYTSQVLSGGK